MKDPTRFFVVEADGGVVLGDGRPSWGPGPGGRTSLGWPAPTTLAGMIRTRAGLSRGADYFSRSANDHRERIRSVRQISLMCPLPLRFAPEGQRWEPLFPPPADAVLFAPGRDDVLDVHGLKFDPPSAGSTTDLPWDDWLYACLEKADKPAPAPPAFWNWSFYEDWLLGTAPDGSRPAAEIGYPRMVVEERVHVAIDPATKTADPGRLFRTQAVRLESRCGPGQYERFGIGLSVRGLRPDDDPSGLCHLGGERRVVQVSAADDVLPLCPTMGPSNFLRLILVSPGNFGHWSPDWLLPDASGPAWRNVPGLEAKARLRSAIVPRWIPISGWDYAAGGPKAMRKLVPAGAVYLIELEDPAGAQDVAEHLWLRSICDDPEVAADGFGVVAVGTVRKNQVASGRTHS